MKVSVDDQSASVWVSGGVYPSPGIGLGRLWKKGAKKRGLECDVYRCVCTWRLLVVCSWCLW